MINFKTNVLLPAWIFEQAKDKDHLKKLVLEYMKKYPDYTIKSIKNGMAVCTKK
ncbi:hypothetical protein V7122_02370 [Bacillus sp. JJ1532]|uniref:hypothetical protein n=1 Tax=Bacillus sp. JJ1532 TaxID=3122958 RepID=UPI002FFE5170